jgi:hypothetical protein
MQRAPIDEAALETALSQPNDEVVRALQSVDGDIVVLGAGGKMGPSLARMARRALDDAGVPREGAAARRVYAVARFSNESLPAQLQAQGVVPLRADLTNRAALAELPDASNVLHLVGQKFGTQNNPVGAWTQNVIAAVHVAERYQQSRIVMFSTGNVYPRTVVAFGGASESHTLVPDGEYAASCIGRERVFEHAASTFGTRVLQFRLCYACDLRYGVVTDIATRVLAGQPVSLATGFANVIWQGDANALALRALTLASETAPALNVSGPIVSVRHIAEQLGRQLQRDVLFDGVESDDALIVNIDALTRALPFEGMSLDTLIEYSAQWVAAGGRLLNKPTRFDVRTGAY